MKKRCGGFDRGGQSDRSKIGCRVNYQQQLPFVSAVVSDILACGAGGEQTRRRSHVIGSVVQREVFCI